uniref:PDEase domain-containing protein n=1 Tax=Romanomermis culicivorax TaxID=13658 RepID=A0A915K6X8_ROMCU
MSMHFGQLKAVKSMINSPDGVDKVRALSLIVHCSDISHPAKLWNTHSKWTMLVLEEFFRQLNCMSYSTKEPIFVNFHLQAFHKKQTIRTKNSS